MSEYVLGPYAEPPDLSLADIRPYCISILMHKGYLVRHEIVSTLTCHCNLDDLRIGGVDPSDGLEYDGSRLEKLADQFIGEAVNSGLLEWSESKQAWILGPSHSGRCLQWAIALNTSMPPGWRQQTFR